MKLRTHDVRTQLKADLILRNRHMGLGLQASAKENSPVSKKIALLTFRAKSVFFGH